MSHYFRRERLEGDNAYKCDKCKSKVPATKKFSIERAPNVLCIQLKRFGLMGGKMSKHINFSRQLNLNRFLFNPTSNGYVSYKFVSLINHMGPSQHCGHYTAIAEASNGQLYLFDDCSVRLVSLNVALSTTAYVLMYEKMHQSPKNMNGASKIQANPPPKVAPSPRPAMISEPERPKVNFQVKSKDTPQKPRLVIHNGNSLFKSTGVTPSTNGTAANPPSLPKMEKNDKPASATITATITATATKTALVPYDTNSDEEDVAPAPIPVFILSFLHTLFFLSYDLYSYSYNCSIDDHISKHLLKVIIIKCNIGFIMQSVESARWMLMSETGFTFY